MQVIMAGCFSRAAGLTTPSVGGVVSSSGPTGSGRLEEISVV